MFTELSIQILMKRAEHKYGGTIRRNERVLAYGLSLSTGLWNFFEYSKARLGLGVLKVVDSDLSEEDALFKRDILIGGK